MVGAFLQRFGLTHKPEAGPGDSQGCFWEAGALLGRPHVPKALGWIGLFSK